MLKYVSNRLYKEAKEIADEIDWRRVKNTSVLCVVSEIYEANREYGKGIEVLLQAYKFATDSRKIVYRLGSLALKMNDVKAATGYYDEFIQLAPKDPNRFILQYKILKRKNCLRIMKRGIIRNGKRYMRQI